MTKKTGFAAYVGLSSFLTRTKPGRRMPLIVVMLPISTILFYFIYP